MYTLFRKAPMLIIKRNFPPYNLERYWVKIACKKKKKKKKRNENGNVSILNLSNLNE